MGKAIDITGERYGKLVAIMSVEKREKNGGRYWLFKCDCGNTKIAPSNSVRRGLIKSCGCIAKPHGKTGTRLHNIWCNMRERCKNDGSKYHKNWGGRGITVCDEWSDYRSFEKWAFENGYNDSLTIDRINTNGDYKPENCRWVTYKEQAKNTRANRYIEINGETHLVSEWCEILKTVNRASVYRRVRNGWTYIDAITTPAIKNGVVSEDESR